MNVHELVFRCVPQMPEDKCMAQKVVVKIVDDLDGTTSADITTVTFALDGVI